MILKKLVFDNYKTYYGTQPINLYIPERARNEEGKNIILIGGLNGAGKTTVLKAILYVLFGKRGLSESEHKKLFSNVINDTFFDEGGRDCSVTLVLETERQEEWELSVSWSFDHYKRVVNENRDIVVRRAGSRHGKHSRIQNMEAYNHFIDRVIPYHAAPFFIFDGEEIREVILRQNSHEMKDAIHKITGMDTYNLLLSDLKAIQKKLQTQVSKISQNKEVEMLQQNFDELDAQMKVHRNKLQEIQDSMRKTSIELSASQERRKNKLMQNVNSREEIIKKIEQKQSRVDRLQDDKTSFIQNNLVKVILNKKIAALKERIQQERELRNKRSSIEASLTPYYNFMNQLLNKNIDPPLTDNQLQQIREMGEEIWIKDKNIDNQAVKLTEIHDLSPKEYQYLNSISVPNTSQFINIVNELERTKVELQKIERELENAPDAFDVSDENDEISDLSKTLGEIELREKAAKRKIAKFQDELTNIKNRISRLSTNEEDIDGVVEEYNMVNGIITATEDFVRQSTRMKAQFIKEQFAEMLGKLFRKKNEFGKIDFDLDTYTVRIFNDRGQEVSVQDRSAGEMQMISSALIWALTKASDLNLPMVIDTPLGRLDSYHRRHLIEHYYKYLSDQVIILSTDTEITEEYVELMKDNSYEQYMLDYDEDKKYTIIREKYFDFINI